MLQTESDTLLTVTEVAVTLRLSPYRVRGLLRDGKLQGVRPGGHGQWRVRASDLARHLDGAAPDCPTCPAARVEACTQLEANCGRGEKKTCIRDSSPRDVERILELERLNRDISKASAKSPPKSSRTAKRGKGARNGNR